jgi:hypothetical protein
MWTLGWRNSTRQAIIFGVVALLATARLSGDEARLENIDAWQQQCQRRLVPATKEQQQAAKVEVHGALDTLREQLDRMPNGVALAKEMNLQEFAQELARERCDAAILSRIERSLAGIWPPAIQYLVNVLRQKTAILSAFSGHKQQRIDDARIALSRLADSWQNPATDDRERIIRDAYEQVADTRLVDDLLVTFRREVSRPNIYMLVTRSYVESVGAKEFTIPVAVVRNMGQGMVAVRGSVAFKLATSLVDNPQSGNVLIAITAAGLEQVWGQRDQIQAFATTRVSARGTELLQLDANGFRSNPLALNVSTTTSLNSLDLAMRCRLGSRIANSLASGIAANRLADADPQVAASIKQQSQARVDDECADTAYRINELFQNMLWERLFAHDLSSDTHYWTTREGIWSSAAFREHQQLGATSAPPELPVQVAERNEIAYWLHESAINNLADALSGRRFDETTFLEILQEQLKLGSRTLDSLPKARVGAALVFADENPLRVSFHDHGLELTIRVQACEAEGATINRHSSELKARYKLLPSESGVALMRAGGLHITTQAAVDPQWLAVVERFLPSEFHSLPHYRNGSFSHFMQLKYLDLSGGWMVTSARRETLADTVNRSTVAGTTP